MLLFLLKKLISFQTVTQEKKESKKALKWIKQKLSKFPLFF